MTKFVLAVAITWCTASVSAAPCRSQSAASTGGTNGYTVDTQAADNTEQRDRSVSDILGQCVAGVTGTMTIPTFPSLDDILNQIKNEICRIASQRVHEAASNVSAEINSALQSVPTGSGPITVPPPSVSIGRTTTSPMAVTTTSAPNATETSSPAWWSRIWR